jgi:hypothetical protein
MPAEDARVVRILCPGAHSVRLPDAGRAPLSRKRTAVGPGAPQRSSMGKGCGGEHQHAALAPAPVHPTFPAEAPEMPDCWCQPWGERW